MTYGTNIWDIGDDIIIELTVNNPTTGLGLIDQESFIELTIQRTSDNFYWVGSAWSVTRTTLTMLQADSTYQAGRYIYTLPGTGGNIRADRYLAHVKLDNPPIISGDVYEVHTSREQSVRLYESEPS